MSVAGGNTLVQKLVYFIGDVYTYKEKNNELIRTVNELNRTVNELQAAVNDIRHTVKEFKAEKEDLKRRMQKIEEFLVS